MNRLRINKKFRREIVQKRLTDPSRRRKVSRDTNRKEDVTRIIYPSVQRTNRLTGFIQKFFGTDRA